MFNTPSYHGILRKLVVGFGTLFSNMSIPRENAAGAVIQTVAVPIAYGPKEKWNVRVDQDPTQENNVYTVIPRMGFEITSYAYDPARMKNRNLQVKCFDSGTGALSLIYTPVPYNVEIALYAQTKGTEDGLAIMEQILPLFAPEYTLNMDAIPEMNITQDVPIILNGVSVQDDYEGDFQTRRLVTHTFNFTAKIELFGPIKAGKLITKTRANVDTTTLGFGEAFHEAEGNPLTGIITKDLWTS